MPEIRPFWSQFRIPAVGNVREHIHRLGISYTGTVLASCRVYFQSPSRYLPVTQGSILLNAEYLQVHWRATSFFATRRGDPG